MLFKRLGFFSKELENNIKRAKDGDRFVLKDIFCVFAENSPKHKKRASEALCDALNNFSINETSIQMRQSTSMEWFIAWAEYEIEDFFTSDMTDEERLAVTAFASFHSNGYLREKAVRELAKYNNSLTFIMLRLKDWVPNVRRTALNSLCLRLENASDEEILKTFPYILKLRRSTRCDYSVVISALSKKLIDNKALLLRGITDKNTQTRKFCVFFIADTKSNYDVLFRIADKEKDPFLRNRIFTLLSEADEDLTTLSDKFLKDKFPLNRVTAIRWLNENHPEAAVQKAKKLLLDKNSLIRDIARDIVGDFDFRKYYIDNLEKNTMGAVYGLGDVGTSEDCALIEPYLSSDKPKLIRSAMSSLMKLDAGKYTDVITEMLLSERTGVVKTAKQLLEKNGDFSYERVLRIYEMSERENTKMKCALLLFNAPKWQRLYYMLYVSDSNFESVRKMSIIKIKNWIDTYNRSFKLPTEAEKERIIKLLEERESFIGSEFKSQLLFLIK